MLKIAALRTPNMAPIDLDIGGGECVAVMGPSGAGKTLFLRAIADLDPNEGAITLFGAERGKFPAPKWRRMVTYLPAESGWWAERVSDHFPKDGAVGEMLDRLGLSEEALGWTVARLSTGERQRLALARALLLRPAVLLLDEPTSGLDETSIATVEKVLKARLAEGVSILFVTHDERQGKRLAKRCLHLKQGRLESEETWQTA
ncbi:MAG: ATP-binding cassette domain-containing protein [Alphaproteobacteria bacterium]|nr:ATP-binding cassette domain-containing protein [Alphaproteobacteria bacterium]